jgi:hypothetical protein
MPALAAIGYSVAPKHSRKFTLPFVIAFIGICIVASVGKRGFDQKFLSFLIIGINILAAIGLQWLWQMKYTGLKILAVVVFFIITISGVIDLMPIKNEFAFPLVPSDSVPVISWIQSGTAKNSVFVSYPDIRDPVVFAGRTNYFGFFGNIGWYDRTQAVGRVYKGDIAYAKTIHISYVLVPKWQNSDFPYSVNIASLRMIMPVVYEDNRQIVFAVQ